MKIALASDVHLEFGPIELTNDQGADVLILSGDICIASELNDYDANGIMGENTRSAKYHEFFRRCAEQFPHVIYIAGNHEHYHGDYALSIPRLKEKLAYIKNLYVLDKEAKCIEDITFIGGTLWTDMNKEDPHTLYAIKKYMNDYINVNNSNNVVNYRAEVLIDKPVGMTDEEFLALPREQLYRMEFKTRTAKLSPEDTVVDHKAMLSKISDLISVDPQCKCVVVGHHSPSKLSTKPQYENDVIVNGAYSSDLSEFILDHPQIVLWTHGHTHHTFDYLIGSTRILCNPRGYIGYERQADIFELKYVNV